MVDGPRKFGVRQQPPPLTRQNQGDLQKAKTDQATKRSPADVARQVSQAGFRPLGAKKRRADILEGDAPIPLPSDEVNGEDWSHEQLDGARESLAMANTQLQEMGEAEEFVPLGELVGGSFLPVEDDVADMEELAKRPAPEPIPMDEVSEAVNRLFGIDMTKEKSIQRRVLATGLVVAGETEAVEAGEDGLNEKKLTQGIQRVTDQCNRRVEEAQKQLKGVDLEINFHRTKIPSRK